MNTELTMNTEYIFAEPLLVAQRDINSQAITDDILSLLEDNESPRISGKDAGKRVDLSPAMFVNNALPNLGGVVNSIIEMVDQFRLSINMKKLEISSIWVNLNGKGGYNQRHAHPTSMVSGVFYVKVPADSESPLLLYKSREAADYGYANAFINDEAPTNLYGSMVIPTEEGKLIMFPSYVEHEVPPNKSEDYRISISFNTRLSDETS
jgi:uncharacterized protein (TIGR02466 family)